MKVFIFLFLAVALNACKGGQVELRNDQDKQSYAYGMVKARTIIDDAKLVGLNKEIVQAAINETLADKAQMDSEEALKHMMTVNRRMIEASEKIYKEQLGDFDPFKLEENQNKTN